MTKFSTRGRCHYVSTWTRQKEGLQWPPLPLTVRAKETGPPTDVLERPERLLPEVTKDGDNDEDDSTHRQTAAADTLLDLAVAATCTEPAKKQ